MPIAWPEELVRDIARRKSVVVLGSGVSRQSVNANGEHPKMWIEFLETGVAQLNGSGEQRKRIKKLIKDNDLLTACDVIKRVMGDANFRTFARSQFLDPQFAHAPIHDAIMRLDSRITATPNLDKIYDSYVNHVQNASVAVKAYYDDDIADFIRSSGRVILKVHGTIEKTNEMVFTRTEYARARTKYRSFYSILEALIMTHTFLFIGCGLNDPDVRLLLEDYAFQHAFGRPHFFVLPKGSVHADVRPTIQGSLNIEILEYDPVNHHQLLVDEVNALVALVGQQRQQLTATLNW
jgi:hypothetical protein